MHTQSTQDFSVEVPNLHPSTGGEHAVVLVGDVRSSTDVPRRPEPRTAGQRHQRGGHAAEPCHHARHARTADQPRVGVDAQQQQVIAAFLPDGGRDGGGSGAAAVVQKILQLPPYPTRPLTPRGSAPCHSSRKAGSMEMQSHPLRKQARTAVRGVDPSPMHRHATTPPPPPCPPVVAINLVGGALLVNCFKFVKSYVYLLPLASECRDPFFFQIPPSPKKRPATNTTLHSLLLTAVDRIKGIPIHPLEGSCLGYCVISYFCGYDMRRGRCVNPAA